MSDEIDAAGLADEITEGLDDDTDPLVFDPETLLKSIQAGLGGPRNRAERRALARRQKRKHR